MQKQNAATQFQFGNMQWQPSVLGRIQAQSRKAAGMYVGSQSGSHFSLKHLHKK